MAGESTVPTSSQVTLMHVLCRLHCTRLGSRQPLGNVLEKGDWLPSVVATYGPNSSRGQEAQSPRCPWET